MIRPTYYKDYSIFDFVKKFNIYGKVYSVARNEAIIKVFPVTKLTGLPEADERYYKYQCLLHIPFTKDPWRMLERSIYRSWKEMFDLRLTHIKTEVEDSNDAEEIDLGEPMPGISNYERQTLADAIRSCPISDKVTALGDRLVDLNHSWLDTDQSLPSIDNVKDFLKTYKDSPVLEEEPELHIKFSKEQQAVLDVLDAQIRLIKENPKFTSIPDFIKSTLIVQGRAGTGKSTLIREIKRRIEAAFGKVIIISAPTGVAAHNVGGSTLHSMFQIPVPLCKYKELQGKPLDTLQKNFRNAKFLIFDEYSMIGANLFDLCLKRLSEARPNHKDIFRGLFIYILGDIKQLVPVIEDPIYAVPGESQKLVTAFVNRVMIFQIL